LIVEDKRRDERRDEEARRLLNEEARGRKKIEILKAGDEHGTDCTRHFTLPSCSLLHSFLSCSTILLYCAQEVKVKQDRNGRPRPREA
jgi:hypothetical protein